MDALTYITVLNSARTRGIADVVCWYCLIHEVPTYDDLGLCSDCIEDLAADHGT